MALLDPSSLKTTPICQIIINIAYCIPASLSNMIFLDVLSLSLYNPYSYVFFSMFFQSWQWKNNYYGVSTFSAWMTASHEEKKKKCKSKAVLVFCQQDVKCIGTYFQNMLRTAEIAMDPTCYYCRLKPHAVEYFSQKHK